MMNMQLNSEQQPIQLHERLYSIQEAALLLCVKPSWLYAKTSADEIPYRRFGKYIKFAQSDIDTIIAMFSRGPVAEARTA
jgi:predicted DNA-binding transcriptional regulator AlpA